MARVPFQALPIPLPSSHIIFCTVLHCTGKYEQLYGGHFVYAFAIPPAPVLASQIRSENAAIVPGRLMNERGQQSKGKGIILWMMAIR